MAQIEDDKVYRKNNELRTAQEFIDEFHPTLKTQSIYYAMNNDLIDWHQRGKVRLVVLTEKTKGYVPNDSKSRQEHSSIMET